MATPGKLNRLEEERGAPASEFIPALVNADGQAGAARQLGISTATISTWLRANGFTAKTIYTRADGIVEVVPDAATRARLAALIIPEVE